MKKLSKRKDNKITKLYSTLLELIKQKIVFELEGGREEEIMFIKDEIQEKMNEYIELYSQLHTK